MVLKSIKLENFRNYRDLFLEIPEEGAFFEGNNGSGKTNLLESIFLLCTGRSQRSASKNEMINCLSKEASVEGLFFSTQEEKRIVRSVCFGRDNFITLAMNNTRVSVFSEWFGTQPIISFAGNDIQIIYGNPSQRRKFLDMLISLIDKNYLKALMEYRKYLSLRNKILKMKFDEILCGIYEEKMADVGSIIMQKRQKCIDEIAPQSESIYRKISDSSDDISIEYNPSLQHDCYSIKTCKELFYTMLAERRKNYKEIGFSSCGPHRDELYFFVNKKPAKSYASQGQCRSLVLALKLSSLAWIENDVHENKIILFDDAVSELDPERSSRVYSLVENRGQIFIASPYKDVPLKDGIQHFRVCEGMAVRA